MRNPRKGMVGLVMPDLSWQRPSIPQQLPAEGLGAEMKWAHNRILSKNVSILSFDNYLPT